jgi:DNA polymerase elongation subunit (family B)
MLSKLTADGLKKRLRWSCPLKGHSHHDGISHNRCYDQLVGVDLAEKVAYLDIETEDLKADYGVMFCWCLWDGNANKLYKDVININDINKYKSHNRNTPPKDDTRIIKSLVDLLVKYDRVYAHYGSRFDLPFLRTRALICGIKFPPYGSLSQTDTWIISKNKLKLSRNTQQNLCLKILGHTRKDHLSHSIKHGCLRGETWALNLSLIHCEKDVYDLRDVSKVIDPFIRKTKTSI